MKFLNWIFRFLLSYSILQVLLLCLFPFEIAGQNALFHLTSAVQRGNLEPLYFLLSSFALNVVVAVFLISPFLIFKRHPHPTLIAVLLILTWIGHAALTSPSLFLGNILHPEQKISQEVFRALVSAGGVPALYVVLAVFLLPVLWRCRLGLVEVAFFILFYGFLFKSLDLEQNWELELPAGSVLLVLSDSLRADHLTPGRAPQLVEQKMDQAATENRVLPISSRTAVSLTGLFTGLMPNESFVSNMFADFSKFRNANSRVQKLKEMGYCTVAVTEYPGDFLSQADFGFSHLDVPAADWNSQMKRVLLKRDPFLLATLSHGLLRSYFPPSYLRIFLGLDEYSHPAELFERLEDQVGKCGGKKVFAVAFTNITHMPYVQRRPQYRSDLREWGHYSWQNAETEELRENARQLYRNSVREFDEKAAKLVSDFFKRKPNRRSSLIISSDHGEYLFDGVDFSGHGDRIGPLKGLLVPWITFGALRKAFPSSTALKSNLEISDMLFSALSESGPQAARSRPLYTETEIWLDPRNRPAESYDYPSGSDLFALDQFQKYVLISGKYEKIVELAKHRAWRHGDEWIEVRPRKDADFVFKDGIETRLSEIPPGLRENVKKVLEMNKSLRSEIKTQTGEDSSR